MQTKLPTLSSYSLHITAEGTTHESLIAEREHTLLVIVDALRQMLEASRNGEHVGGTDRDAMNVIRPEPGGR